MILFQTVPHTGREGRSAQPFDDGDCDLTLHNERWSCCERIRPQDDGRITR